MVKVLKNISSKYEWIRILWQLIYEFFIPFLISVAWTLYDAKEESAAELLQNGIVHFFAVGWAFSQWNRVKKQLRAERNLSSVGDDVKGLIKKLEQQTDDLIGYSSSKDSYCLVELVPSPEHDPFLLMLRHYGKYPVFDLSLEVWDYNVFESMQNEGITQISDRIIFKFPSVHPSDYKMLNFSPRPKVDSLGQVKLSFLCASRSGEYRQDLTAVLMNDQWVYATRVVSEGVVFSEDIPSNFPRNNEGTVDWYTSSFGSPLKQPPAG